MKESTKMEDYDGFLNNPIKVRYSQNLILNSIGNVCGYVANLLLRVSFRWGTYYVYDMKDYDEDSEWLEDTETGDAWRLIQNES